MGMNFVSKNLVRPNHLHPETTWFAKLEIGWSALNIHLHYGYILVHCSSRQGSPMSQARGESWEIGHLTVGFYKDSYGRWRSIAKPKFYRNNLFLSVFPCHPSDFSAILPFKRFMHHQPRSQSFFGGRGKRPWHRLVTWSTKHTKILGVINKHHLSCGKKMADLSRILLSFIGLVARWTRDIWRVEGKMLSPFFRMVLASRCPVSTELRAFKSFQRQMLRTT